MFKLHTVLTKELDYSSLKLKKSILLDCNQQKLTEAKQSKHSETAAWGEGQQPTYFCAGLWHWHIPSG